MFSDKNNSLYIKNNNSTSIEIHKKNITIINNSYFIYEINGYKLNFHCSFENVTKNVIKINTTNLIHQEDFNSYIYLDSKKIFLTETKTLDNNSLEELKNLLEEYKEETNDLKSFVSSKIKGKTKDIKQFPKR